MPAERIDPDAEQAARQQLVRFGRRMVADGLVVGSAGNLSIRLGDAALITPTGVPYDDLATTDMCLVSLLDGRRRGPGRPSSEFPMHRLIYSCTDAGAVVHTHSTAAVAVSITCAELPAVHYSILQLGGTTVRVAAYRTFGSDDLAASAVAALEGRTGALLQNHGGITYGADLAQAYLRAQVLEWLSDIYLRSRAIGPPRLLSEEELAAVAESARRRRYEGA
ncbi:MAG TPA: class II aldolase/adducin family protein [Acidimicrobiales bacterium]|nr:class II aldolase/adducin family protein [Acidimicrobiales bacterium]